MQTKINANIYDEYFKYRNVTPLSYEGYVLPAYLQNVLPDDKKTRIIDIGCGLGQTLLALKKLGYENIKGIDISSYAVNQCKAKNLNVSISKNIVSYCNKSKQKYDFIIMSHVLEHIAKTEIIDTLRAIHNKILYEKGILCIMVPNAQSNTGSYWAYEDFTHSVLFTAGSLYYVLKSAGFNEIEFLDVDGLQHLGFLKKMIKSALLKCYRANRQFWNKVTMSSYHVQSPMIFSFEIKAIGKK